MWKNFFLDDDRQIFQSQLVALLKKKATFPDAVRNIEAKAPARLKQKLGRAGMPLLPGLLREGLITPEFASLLARGNPPDGVDADIYLRRCLDDEVEASRLDLQIRGQFSRVFLLFGITTAYALIVKRLFLTFVGPALDQASAFYAADWVPPPRHWQSEAVYLGSLTVMVAFLGTLACIYLALKLDGNEQRRRFGFLLSAPFLRGVFRKRATRRLLAHCSSLMGAGADSATAITVALTEFGLHAGPREAPIPCSALLDPLSIEAINLGASLETFEAQLEAMLALLRQDIPYTAQKVTRVIYYAGYVALGLLVGSLLIQLYGPIFQIASPSL